MSIQVSYPRLLLLLHSTDSKFNEIMTKMSIYASYPRLLLLLQQNVRAMALCTLVLMYLILACCCCCIQQAVRAMTLS